jgi:hypothetical protein
MPVWRGSPIVGKTTIHAKLSLNSTNNLNYKETSPEFRAGQRKKKNKKKIKKIIIYVNILFPLASR